MTCREVQNAIGNLTRRGEASDVIKAHLAACPTCARWADQARRLDRAWEATRPESPEPERWERVWTRVEAALAEPEPAPGVLSFTKKPRGLRSSEIRFAGVLIAAAAAVLAAFGWMWLNGPNGDGEPGAPPSDGRGFSIARANPPQPIQGAVNAEIGPPVVYRIDDDQTRVVPRDDDSLGSVDPFLLLLNNFEWLPELMASAEFDSGSPFGSERLPQ